MKLDMTLGINKVAYKVARLVHIPNKLLGPGSYETRAFYNGRERGIVFSISPNWEKTLHVLVAEQRNSDKIIVWAWFTDYLGLNPPTIGDIKAPAAVLEFSPERVSTAAREFSNIVKSFLKGEFNGVPNSR